MLICSCSRLPMWSVLKVAIFCEIRDVCPPELEKEQVLLGELTGMNLLNAIIIGNCSLAFHLYLTFLTGAAFSGVPSVPNPFWNKILLLFGFIYALLFSFAKASYFALFLHNVENLFLTALSVLHKQKYEQYWSYNLKDKAECTNKGKRTVFLYKFFSFFQKI